MINHRNAGGSRWTDAEMNNVLLQGKEAMIPDSYCTSFYEVRNNILTSKEERFINLSLPAQVKSDLKAPLFQSTKQTTNEL